MIVITNVMSVTTHPTPAASHEPGHHTDMTAVNDVINLISKGFHCSIAPINLNEEDDDVKVFCDKARYSCYECVKNIQIVGENDTNTGIEADGHNNEYVEIVSSVSESMIRVLSELVHSGHTCGVTTVQVSFRML